MMPRLLIFGAGGHARVVVTLARRTGAWEIVGVLDRLAPTALEIIDGTAVIGGFEDAARLFAGGIRHAALAVGDNRARAELQAHLTALGFEFPVLCHPTAIVEDTVKLGDGTLVCAGAILGAQVVVGRGVIVNTGAILDHETQVGDHAHIAPGCRVAGRVSIGTGVMLGIGSSVRERISIGAHALLGAGSVVVEDISAGVTAFGVPARVAPSRKP
jgi:sugar O-acyltransferase (sialic acid O-acetyltransferase NeuD family)